MWNNTVDHWTTWFWTAQVHLYGYFFQLTCGSSKPLFKGQLCSWEPAYADGQLELYGKVSDPNLQVTQESTVYNLFEYSFEP